jgi:hypothetical protein
MSSKSGTTPGEMSAAREAFDRVMKRVSDEHGVEEAEKAKSRALAGRPQHSSKPRRQEPQRPETRREQPKARPDMHRVFSYGQFDEVHLFRKVDPDAGKRGSNRVWGYAKTRGRSIDHPVLVFWGPFGKTLQKMEKPYSGARKLAFDKENSGYRRIRASNIDAVDYGWFLSQLSRW